MIQQPSHRARIPNLLRTQFRASCRLQLVAAALDLEEAVYERIWGCADLQVRETMYAHRTRRGLLVSTLEFQSGSVRNVSWASSPGSASVDISFNPPLPTDSGVSCGSTLVGEEAGELRKVCVASSALSGSVAVSSQYSISRYIYFTFALASTSLHFIRF